MALRAKEGLEWRWTVTTLRQEGQYVFVVKAGQTVESRPVVAGQQVQDSRVPCMGWVNAGKGVALRG
jgi:hypothetical protein